MTFTSIYHSIRLPKRSTLLDLRSASMLGMMVFTRRPDLSRLKHVMIRSVRERIGFEAGNIGCLQKARYQ